MKRIALIVLALVLVALSVCACTDKHHSGSKEETTETVTSFETDPIEYVTSFETDSEETVQTDETQATPETTVKDEKPQYTVEELAEVLHLSSTMVSVLSNEAKLRDPDPIWKEKEFVYLQDFIGYFPDKTPSTCAFDFDEDGINEVVILEGTEVVVILREYEGTVHGWRFGFRGMYNLRIDGTYDWGYQEGDVFTYGTSKLNFNGADWNSIELDRIDDIDDNRRYYIGGTEVTEEEYKAYVQSEELAEKAERYTVILDFKSNKS